MKKLWKLILGVLFLISSFGLIRSNTGAFIFGALIGVAFIFLWYNDNRKKKVGNTPEEHISNKKYCSFKVKGVTFKNDDGTDRQSELRKIKFKDEPYDKASTVSITEYQYEGSPALAVNVNGFMIGNVPKEDVPFLMDNFGRIERISALDVYGGGYNEETGSKMSYGAKVTVQFK